MELNKGQEEALKLAVERYKHGYAYTYIAGAAGTGKSTLVRFIIAALDLNPNSNEVCYATFTGKAALNLQRKGCASACTLHSLLYNARQNKSTGVYYFSPKPYGALREHKLIVVDEISMVTQEMWELLLSHKIHILALGDIAQLPAIGTKNAILDKPHIVLTEIMRQEEDSEIIQIATLARTHQPIPFMKGKNVMVLHKDEYNDAMLDWADMTICATNKTRARLNTRARERIWGDGTIEPQAGDRIVCLHNEWDKVTDLGDALVNGMVGTLVDDMVTYDLPPKVRKYSQKMGMINFLPDFREDEPKLGTFRNLFVDHKLLTEGVPTVTDKNFREFRNVTHLIPFDYGYAMSCHKCQGSEYNKVLVIEEGFPYSEEEHWQWLYTAATRAIDKLVIVRNF